MIKDYLKFRNAIKKDTNLSLEECYMLEVLFDYYNAKSGYAYPSYETLMSDLKTCRKAKISKNLKSLVKKGYISITKVGKKNTYKILKYLFLNNGEMPVDSNGKPPVDGQVHFADVAADEPEPDQTGAENEVMNITGFTKKQAGKILKAAKEKIEEVKEAFNYAVTQGADNLYTYTTWAVKNISKVRAAAPSVVSDNKTYIPKTKFDNFEPRQYDYADLEKRLLGWA